MLPHAGLQGSFYAAPLPLVAPRIAITQLLVYADDVVLITTFAEDDQVAASTLMLPEPEQESSPRSLCEPEEEPTGEVAYTELLSLC